MAEHIADFGALVKKYDKIIFGLEQQILEAKRKKAIVIEAIELLQKEGIFEQKLFELPPIQLSTKYSKMSMTKAIKDILQATNEKGLSVEEIYTELSQHGFKSKSQNLKRDVYTRLYRLEQDKKLSSFKEGGLKKYKLPEKEKEAKREQKEQGLTISE